VPSVSDFGQRVRGWFQREPRVAAPRNILIVDGNSSERQATVKLVESLGYQAVQATSAGAAREQVQEREPEFILLGFDLDDATGMEALTQMRELDPDLPIIMVAPNLWDSRVAEAMRKGAVAYLAQPWGADDLRELLGRH
jgi:DNA-binding NtrC family response regulator